MDRVELTRERYRLLERLAAIEAALDAVAIHPSPAHCQVTTLRLVKGNIVGRLARIDAQLAEPLR